MNRYLEYKDSGIEWIRQFPFTKAVNDVTKYAGKVPKSKFKSEGKFPVVDQSQSYISGYTDDGTLLYGNTLPVIIFGDHTRIFKFIDQPFVLGADGVKVFAVHRKFVPKYFYYCALSLQIPDAGYSRHFKFLKDATISIPPLSEQIELLKYLDKKTSQIDSLTEKLEKKIELLKEYRVALISQCVTKGLDPDVEMKDSGIEWIGEIPKQWQVKRLAAIGRFSKGKSITKSDLVSDGYPCILYGELYTKFDRLVLSCFSRIGKQLFDKSVKVESGTFLLTSSGETADEIGKCVLVVCEEPVAIGGDTTIFRVLEGEEFDIEFLSFVLNSNFCQHQKAANSRGEIVVHIYERQFRDLKIVISPISEQVQISKFLNNKTTQIDSLTEKLERKIELLKEFRKSLISNVVTGKIRVTEDIA